MKTEFGTTSALRPGRSLGSNEKPGRAVAHVTALYPQGRRQRREQPADGCRGRRTSSVTPTTAEISARAKHDARPRRLAQVGMARGAELRIGHDDHDQRCDRESGRGDGGDVGSNHSRSTVVDATA